MKKIITIGRQYGSGGREIGELVAKKLGVPFYDKKLILLAAEKSGLSAETIEKADETATNSFLYAISTGNYFLGGMFPGRVPELPATDMLYKAQSEIITAAAEEGPCVIVGRCADAILDDRDDVLRVFVRAEEEDRVTRIMERVGVDRKEAAELVSKTDKKRSSYYNFYAQKRWGEVESYDLMINHSKISTEEAVALIASIAEK